MRDEVVYAARSYVGTLDDSDGRFARWLRATPIFHDGFSTQSTSLASVVSNYSFMNENTLPLWMLLHKLGLFK